MNKTYKDIDNIKLNLIIDEMFDNDEGCGISEIVGVICGDEFYDSYDNKDLDYVKEVMRDFCYIEVDFNLENEEMYVVKVLDGSED